MSRRRPNRRAPGEGSVYRRADTGKYQAGIVVGYNDRGNPVRVKRSFSTKSEATAWLAQQRALRDRGSVLRQTQLEPTLLDAYEQWIEAGITLNKWAASTTESYRWICERYILPHLGARQLSKIRAGTVRSFLQVLAREGASDATLKRVHRHLVMLLNDAVRTELVESNPAVTVTPPAGERPSVQRWNEEEVGAVVRHCLDMDQPIKRYVLVAIGTGLRIEELLGLHWDSVDLEDSSLVVRRVATEVRGYRSIREGGKTVNAERVVPFDEITRRALLAQREYATQDLVFPNSVGEIWGRTQLRAAFNRVIAATGVSRIKLYATRSTHGSLLADAGVNLHALAERLGHSDPRFTAKVYLSGSSSAHRGVADRFGELLERAAELGAEPGAESEHKGVAN